jgi:hypothetical protein
MRLGCSPRIEPAASAEPPQHCFGRLSTYLMVNSCRCNTTVITERSPHARQPLSSIQYSSVTVDGSPNPQGRRDARTLLS